MALNILGGFGALGRLFPGYVQGQRQAVQDNWNDLTQYNQVQGGQMQNAFDEALFNPRLSMGYDQAALSRMGVYNSGMDMNIRRMAYPGAMQRETIGSMLTPALYAQMLMGQLGQAQAGSNLWWNPQSQNYYGTFGIPQANMLGMYPYGGVPQQQQNAWMGAWPWLTGQFQQQGAMNLPSTVYP